MKNFVIIGVLILSLLIFGCLGQPKQTEKQPAVEKPVVSTTPTNVTTIPTTTETPEQNAISATDSAISSTDQTESTMNPPDSNDFTV